MDIRGVLNVEERRCDEAKTIAWISTIGGTKVAVMWNLGDTCLGLNATLGEMDLTVPLHDKCDGTYESARDAAVGQLVELADVNTQIEEAVAELSNEQMEETINELRQIFKGAFGELTKRANAKHN